MLIKLKSVFKQKPTAHAGSACSTVSWVKEGGPLCGDRSGEERVQAAGALGLLLGFLSLENLSLMLRCTMREPP